MQLSCIILKSLMVTFLNSIIGQLKRGGAKITPARRLLLDVLIKKHQPLSELELRQALSKRGLNVNKSTIYRELHYFKTQGLVKEVDFGDGKKRFEFVTNDHHHHVRCLSCNKIDEVLVDRDVQAIEQKLKKEKKFATIDHSLEFYGLCRACSPA